MAKTARLTAHDDADVLVVLIEPRPPDADFIAELNQLSRLPFPKILALNKIDLPVDASRQQAALEACAQALKPDVTLRLCALIGQGVEVLVREIVSRLPQSPPLYDRDWRSDRWERFFAAEIIRESLFSLYGEEVPHACAVVIEQFNERQGQPDRIMATLYVERDGQKGIILGRKGQTLRDLQEKSRKAIQSFLNRRVELELWIKVRKDWRKDVNSLKEFGYLP